MPINRKFVKKVKGFNEDQLRQAIHAGITKNLENTITIKQRNHKASHAFVEAEIKMTKILKTKKRAIKILENLITRSRRNIST